MLAAEQVKCIAVVDQIIEEAKEKGEEYSINLKE